MDSKHHMAIFDPSKLRSKITKSIKSISSGFRDPKVWLDTGNYALNYYISGDFYRGVPLGKFTMFAGESGCLPGTSTVTAKINNAAPATVTVAALRTAWADETTQDIQVSTPDGYCRIGNWFDKGSLPMMRVTTANHVTECAGTHFLQRPDYTWMYAKDVQVGDVLVTTSGNQAVTAVTPIADAVCYDFQIMHPNHRYWGDGFSSHNSGKSYICSGNLVRAAQASGVYPIILDSENAIDEAWLQALGVDTSPEKLLRYGVTTVDEVASIITEIIDNYKDTYEEKPESERPPVLIVIDSLGMLETPTEQDQFAAGDMKGDMGRKAKQLKALIKGSLNKIAPFDIGIVASNHTYASQNPYAPDAVISGGCLVSGTMVRLADGSLCAIEDIEVDDHVQTLDGDKRVAETWSFEKQTYTLFLSNGTTVRCSPEHQFLALREGIEVWTLAEDLHPGEPIKNVNGPYISDSGYPHSGFVVLMHKEFHEQETPVYDISVEDAHHYILEDGTVSHNSGSVFAASIIVSMTKLKLKEDEDGNKISEVAGIRSKMMVAKTRYAKPFESVEVHIPYATGMSPYSGLVEFLEKQGILVKDGNKLAYTKKDGELVKMWRKEWNRNDGEVLDYIMKNWDDTLIDGEVGVGEEHSDEGDE